jgi:hypothetical protein
MILETIHPSEVQQIVRLPDIEIGMDPLRLRALQTLQIEPIEGLIKRQKMLPQIFEKCGLLSGKNKRMAANSPGIVFPLHKQPIIDKMRSKPLERR